MNNDKNDSILSSIKKGVGIQDDYKAYDPDIIMYANSAFMTLQQLGVGPTSGFTLVDEDNLWFEVIPNDQLWGALQAYVILKVRLYFDPPQTSFGIAAIEKQIEELEWRLCSQTQEINHE